MEIDNTTDNIKPPHKDNHKNDNENMANKSSKPDFADYVEEDNETKEQSSINNLVAVIVGKWAMPTTVMLVLITCMSGYFLSETAFTPVVGMIAPVVMALIMVIKEASVGKDEDPGVKDREGERQERTEQYRQEKEVKLAQMELDERLKNQASKEQARQVDMFHSSTKDFVDLIKEMNHKTTLQMTKPKSTELMIGETKIKISDGGTSVSTTEEELSNVVAKQT